jgi:hypothetical protein
MVSLGALYTRKWGLSLNLVPPGPTLGLAWNSEGGFAAGAALARQPDASKRSWKYMAVVWCAPLV